MKKIIFILSLGFVSCMEPNIGYPSTERQIDSTTKDSSTYPIKLNVEFSSIPLSVVLIDSCEYLYGPWGSGTVLCHKGNCKNPIHNEHNVYDLINYK